jgi:hypothetical protein
MCCLILIVLTGSFEMSLSSSDPEVRRLMIVTVEVVVLNIKAAKVIFPSFFF